MENSHVHGFTITIINVVASYILHFTIFIFILIHICVIYICLLKISYPIGFCMHSPPDPYFRYTVLWFTPPSANPRFAPNLDTQSRSASEIHACYTMLQSMTSLRLAMWEHLSVAINIRCIKTFYNKMLPFINKWFWHEDYCHWSKLLVMSINLK